MNRQLYLQPAFAACYFTIRPSSQSLFRDAACQHLQIPSLFSSPSYTALPMPWKSSISTAVHNTRQACSTIPWCYYLLLIHWFQVETLCPAPGLLSGYQDSSLKLQLLHIKKKKLLPFLLSLTYTYTPLKYIFLRVT